MAYDPIEFVVQKLKTLYPDLDLSGGSAFRDFFVEPLGSLLTSLKDTYDIFETDLSLANYSGMSEAVLDSIASNYLVSRVAGAKALGYVRIYFKDAKSITIPANTEFQTSAGLRFFSVNEFSVTQSQMLANIEKYPLYGTGDILVQAEAEGLDYQIGPGEIRTVNNLRTAYSSVTNLSSFTGGTNKTNNAEVYQAIVDSAYNSTLNSNKGIEKVILSNFGGIEDVLVVGVNNALMQRDILVDTTRPDYISYEEVDFRGKVLGQNNSPFPQSRAFYGSFVDVNLTNSGFLVSEFPVPLGFSREFSQVEYSNIYEEDALITSMIPSQVLLSEDFSSSGYAGSWSLSDEYTGFGVIIYSGEITVGNGKLYLGNDPNRTFNNYILIPPGMVALISGYLDQLVLNLPTT